jgi:hypothetical protein
VVVKRFMWTLLSASAAGTLFRIAISRRAYTVTSFNVRNHVALRKTYALGAFTLVGFLLQRASLPGLRSIAPVSVAVGLFSAAIELGQLRYARTNPGRRAHAYDILSGVIGGALGQRIGAVLAELRMDPAPCSDPGCGADGPAVRPPLTPAPVEWPAPSPASR